MNACLATVDAERGDRVTVTNPFDTIVRRDDLLNFARSFMRWQNAGGAAYDKVREYLGLATDEHLYVGHLARIGFDKPDPARDSLLNGQLPGIISGYLNAMFGLQPASTPCLWVTPH